MIGLIRIALVLLIFSLVTLPLLPLQALSVKLERWWYQSLPVRWHRLVLKLLGIRVHVAGEVTNNRPLLLVANHVSWTDIMVLGSIAKLSFIAKDEVRSWPLFGTLAMLQRSVFVDRNRKGTTVNQTNEIAARMMGGDVLVLFAEGTTSDGNRVLPFKTSLFGAAKLALGEGRDATVFMQPVSIAYTRLQGIATGRYHRSVAAWPGSIGLLPHLWRVLLAGAIDVEVKIGPLHHFTQASDRKSLAREVEREVRAMHQESVTGQTQLNKSHEKL